MRDQEPTKKVKSRKKTGKTGTVKKDPVSLYPLSVEEVMSDLFKVPLPTNRKPEKKKDS
jgi:hypothetical protein